MKQETCDPLCWFRQVAPRLVQVALRDVEPVVILLQHPRPLLARVSASSPTSRRTLGPAAASALSASGLMERAPAVAVGVLDDDHGRVGDVHLDDGSRDEDLRIARPRTP